MSYFGGDEDDDYVKEDDSELESQISGSDSNSIISEDDEEMDDNDEYNEYNEDDNEEEEQEQDEDEQMGGADPDQDVDDEFDESDLPSEMNEKKIKNVPTKADLYKKPADYIPDDDYNEDDEEKDGEQYLQKLDQTLNENYVLNNHPESILHNYDEIEAMSKVVRNENGIIVDDLHKTIPFLTKYERARILGQRAIQINAGAPPFVKVPENIIDGLIIAQLELEQKLIPFIIRRPLPNGGSEYWKLSDLENIMF
jgi:DNA-directed RNA polymerase I, II, and III subunit RPABC2